jgi:hypothetical protein
LVGPSLFLALALMARGARAESAAGLDAQGVDPRTAIENRWGLDVRDTLGRPVTREQVLSDFKGATVKRAADNAFMSSLPRARAVLSALELLAEAAAAFRMATSGFSLPELLPGLPGGRPRVEIMWLLALACASLTVSFIRRREPALARSSSRQSSIQVLRL